MTTLHVFARRLHLLCATIAGTVLVVAGVTGGALVFRDEIDRALNPELLLVRGEGARIAAGTALRAARVAFADATVARIELPRAADEPIEIVMRGEDPLQVYVDPYTAAVLGSRRQSQSFAHQLFEVHTTLLAGRTGEIVMGATGVMLVIMAVTGIIVWSAVLRRGGRAILSAAKPRRFGNWKRTNFELHRSVGIWAALLLAVSGATGAALVFHDAAAFLLDTVTHSTPRKSAPAMVASHGRLLSPDSLLAIAQHTVPGLAPYYVIFPGTPNAATVVRGHVSGELHPNGRNFVYVDGITGAVLAAESSRRAPVGTRMYDKFYPIHIGKWGGWPVRVLYAGLGLTPLLLAVTGALAWWNRRGRRLSGERKADPSKAARRNRERAVA